MSDQLISRQDAETDILSAAAYLAEGINSADGYADAMSAVVPLYLNKGDVDIAAELANSVDDSYSRDRLLTQVAEKCAEIDDDEYALQLAEAIEDVGLRSQAFERVGQIKAGKGQFDNARDIASGLDHPDFLYAAIAVKQAGSGERTAARETLNAIDFPSARLQGFLEIAGADIAAGNFETAVEDLQAGEDATVQVEHNEERIRGFIEIGNLYIEAKRKELAVAVFDKAKSEAETLDNVHRDSFLAWAAVGFFHSGSLELADRTLDLVADKTQTASALLGFSREFWRREERTEAIDALEESYAILKSQRESETRNSKTRFGLFTSIAAQFAGFEKGERAIEIANSIADESEQTSGLSQVAEILTLRKEDDQARHALQTIADDADRAFALIRMSDARTKNGDRDGATAFLEEAAHLVESVPQLSARSTAYNEIAKRYSAFGDAGKKAEITALNLATIGTIRDASSKVTALADAADLFAPDELPPEIRQSIAKLLG